MQDTGKALAVSKRYIDYWNKQTNRESAITDMLLETKKALSDKYATVACDNAKQPVNLAKKIMESHKVQVYNAGTRNKRIDLAFLKDETGYFKASPADTGHD